MADLTRRSLLAAAPALPLMVRSPSTAQDPELPGRTARTRFAANVEMWWTSLRFEDRIRAAAKLGFPAIEFWPWQGKDIDAVAALCKELRLEVAQFTAWGFEPGLNEARHHGAFVEQLQQACAVAHKLGCKKMTVVGGNDVAGMTPAQMHDQIIAGLRLGAPIAEQADVMLLLEPMNIRVDHKGHCLYGSEPAVRICRAVGSTHVKINWDLYHMQLSEGDLCGHLRDGFDQLGYAQVADTPGRCEPGTGEINYARVLHELWDLGYRGFVGAECRPKTSELEAARALARVDQAT